MFTLEELSNPAKAEALRFGHTAMMNSEELTEFLEAMTQFLLEGEHFAVVPLSSVAGTVRMYSVRIVPIVIVRQDIHPIPSHDIEL